MSIEEFQNGHDGGHTISGYQNAMSVATVKPVLSGHSNIDKTNVFKTNGSLLKVKSIAECSWSILQ